ncbi:MAG: aspartyl protease family protein, partial [Saprospiraceae bacterium]|nr:aspartyl protease family protein [Saprospiraceae bacterium]
MRPILAISLLLFTLFRASAQRVFVPGDPIRKGADIVDIPFEYSNGFILIDLVFDRHFPLRFLFDTGAENTILTKKEITDILGIPYQRTFPIIGADMRTELTAHLATGIHLRIGVMELPLQPILVLDEDFFQFE